MSISRAFSQGFRKAGASFHWLLLIFVVQFLLVLFPGLAMKGAIQHSLEHKQAAVNMLQSFDEGWLNIFTHYGGGLEKTFRPAVSGPGAVLESLNAFLTGALSRTYVLFLGLGIIYLLVWTFFDGGLISRFQKEPTGRGFFASSAHFFWRIFVVTFLAGVVYWLLFSYLLPWLNGLVSSATRETVDERVHFAYTVVKYLIIWLLAWSVSLVADYAKIHIVLRDLRNPITGLGRAFGFVYGNFFKTYGLYFLIGLVGIVVMVLYIWLAPGAAHASWGMVLFTFLFGEVYILWRIFLRALFLSAQTALVEQ